MRKKIGALDRNGIPLVAVVVDRTLSKISYKARNNVLSRVAAHGKGFLHWCKK